MTNKTTVSTPVFAGIDVGAAELVLVIRHNAVSLKAQSLPIPRRIANAWCSDFQSSPA